MTSGSHTQTTLFPSVACGDLVSLSVRANTSKSSDCRRRLVIHDSRYCGWRTCVSLFTMSFVKLSKCPSNPETPSFHHVRPRFPHNHTHDRNREGSDRHPSLSLMTGKIKKDRKSVFKELDIDSDQPFHHYPGEREFGEITGLRIDNESDDGTSYRQSGSMKSPTTPTSPSSGRPWYSKLTPGRRPRISSTASAPPPGMSSFTRLTTLALFIAVVIPGFSYYNGREKVLLSGADAGVIREVVQPSGPILETRTDSSTDYCARWAGQSE